MAGGDEDGPALTLGPLLRHVDEASATIWVETDRPCQVEVLGRRARTFTVAGHHYALVVIDGLRPGTEYEYTVTLDAAVRWPAPDSVFPPSTLRTLDGARPRRLLFGSCRVAEIPDPRRRRARARDQAEHGPDALVACALGLPGQPRDSWPDALLLIGDQVYADEPGPRTREFIAARRDPARPPGYQVDGFEEYCALYREAWSEPAVRWLLSVIPTLMIFDDHDVHDDWNTSASWRRDFAAKPWWQPRMRAALMSYWLYQHLGNLSPAELGKDELWREVREAGDAAALLGDFAARADAQADGAGTAARWSFRRDFGRVRVIVIDSRADRVLDERERRMTSKDGWQWVVDSAAGDWDHVVLASSLPVLLDPGIHALETWNAAVCRGAWGARLARAGERMRRAVDLEHWPAFGASFADFEHLLASVASGRAAGGGGEPPSTVTVLGGDVHHSYLAVADLPAGSGARSAVYQAVCSPIHNALPPRFRRLQQLATSRAGVLLAVAAARLSGAGRPATGWRFTGGPWFHNMLATLDFDGREARIRFERAACDPGGVPRLRLVKEGTLS